MAEPKDMKEDLEILIEENLTWIDKYALLAKQLEKWEEELLADHPPMNEKDVLRLVNNGWDYERAKGIVKNYNDARAGWLGKKDGL